MHATIFPRPNFRSIYIVIYNYLNKLGTKTRAGLTWTIKIVCWLSKEYRSSILRSSSIISSNEYLQNVSSEIENREDSKVLSPEDREVRKFVYFSACLNWHGNGKYCLCETWFALRLEDSSSGKNFFLFVFFEFFFKFRQAVLQLYLTSTFSIVTKNRE